MPPKARIQKEHILQAAFTLVRKEGLNSLHARGVANELSALHSRFLDITKQWMI